MGVKRAYTASLGRRIDVAPRFDRGNSGTRWPCLAAEPPHRWKNRHKSSGCLVFAIMENVAIENIHTVSVALVASVGFDLAMTTDRAPQALVGRSDSYERPGGDEKINEPAHRVHITGQQTKRWPKAPVARSETGRTLWLG